MQIGKVKCLYIQYSYFFVLQKEQTLLFSNGRAKMGGERESVPRPKKWPVGHLLVPGAEVMEGLFIETEPTDMSHGDLTDIEVTWLLISWVSKDAPKITCVLICVCVCYRTVTLERMQSATETEWVGTLCVAVLLMQEVWPGENTPSSTLFDSLSHFGNEWLLWKCLFLFAVYPAGLQNAGCGPSRSWGALKLNRPMLGRTLKRSRQETS